MCKSIYRTICTFIVFSCLIWPSQSVLGQASVVGQWTSSFSLPHDATHVVQLKTGRVFIGSHQTSSQSSTFLPTANGISNVITTSMPAFFFCGGQSTMADGKFFMNGGEGSTAREAAYYDPDTESWTSLPLGIRSRWYPQTIILGDGRLLIYGGFDQGEQQQENTVEIFDPDTNSYTLQPGTIPWQHNDAYLRVHLMKDGRIFQSQQDNQSYYYTVGGGWTQGPVNAIGFRFYAPSIRLLGTDDRIFICGGNDGNETPSGNNNNTQIVNLDDANPQWQTVAPMNFQRGFHFGILLPNGHVFVINNVDGSGAAATTPEMYNPDTNTWTNMANNVYYSGLGDHHGIILLRDGRVMNGGDLQSQAQWYSPPYLFTGSRPTITSSPTDAGYGGSINVGYTTTNGLSSAVLIRPSGATHCFNTNQIGVPLSITNDTGSQLTLSIPANSNMVPPGYYMLFLLDNSGAPSVAEFIRISGTVIDTDPPTPNPATFATPPFATGQTSVDMVATAGSDATPPVEYFFDETSGNSGGTDSGWQTSTSYSDTGLSSGTQYCYTVQMRDAVGTPNVGGVSSQSCATTQLPNQNPPTPNPMTWASVPTAAGTDTINMTATTATDDLGGTVEYFFDETTGNPGGTDSAWQTSTSYSDTGLQGGTTFTYRVKARDPEGNETGYSASLSAKTDFVSATLTPYLDALPIPSVATPTSGTSGGVASYTITMQEVQTQVHSEFPANSTTLWGYDGMVPGPTIEASENNQVDVTWVNDLRDTSQGATPPLRSSHYLNVDTCVHGPDMFGTQPYTVVHLHGTHAQAQFDGYPEDIFYPGQSSIVHQYPNLQNDGTLWYHDHGLGITRLNVYMGLAGFYIIRDPAHAALNLPSGEYEVPLMMMDRTFNVDGSLVYQDEWGPQFFGDKMVVNGKVWPFMNVKKGKYRFRMLNACGSRVLNLSLSNGHTFHQIGSDGGLLAAPVAMTSLTLGNAERADVVIDFSSFPTGTEIELTNDAPAPYPGTPGVGVLPQVMKFIVTADTGHTASLPGTLDTLVPISQTPMPITRELRLEQGTDPGCNNGTIFTINGLKWNDITEQPILNSTEIWNFVNTTGMVHPMHMHLVMFQVLDRQGFQIVDNVVVPQGSPTTYDLNTTGFKDTVMVMPGEMVRVIATFTDYLGKFPYHCHNIEHEDHEMMRQFEVVSAPDTNAPTPDPATWATVPAAHTDTSIVMTATTGTDDTSGVQYYFEETSGNPGGSDSGWIFTPTYYDFSLQPNTQYSYRVKMRDTSTNLNETVYSNILSATTLVSDGNIDIAAGDVGAVFTPQHLTIDMGQTVEWTFHSSGHNVMAGVPGVHTGYFRSIPQGSSPDVTNAIGEIFTHTFDQAFVNSNPGDGGAPNIYNYHCHPHGQSLGMTGTITVNLPPDSDPPTPNPMTFASAPAATSCSSITMMATTASDAGGSTPIEYLFTETTGGSGATDSNWQISTTYVDNGLAAATQYTYNVQARDALGNTTSASSNASATTDSVGGGWTIVDNTDSSIVYGGAGSWQNLTLYPSAINGTVQWNIETAGTVTYNFTGTGIRVHHWSFEEDHSVSISIDSVNQGTFNAGVSQGAVQIFETTSLSNGSHTIVLTGVSGEPHFDAFEVQAGGGSCGADVNPPTPDPATFASPPGAGSDTAISMTATTGSDASGPVEYLFEESSGNVGGTSSSWQTSTSYTDTGLTAATQYTYSVQMRDSVGNTTAVSARQSATTTGGGDVTPPVPNPATFQIAPNAIDDASISMTASLGNDPSGPVEYNFDETSGNPGGTDSGWQVIQSYTDIGLTASTQYCYTVQLRDSVGNSGAPSSQSCATTQAPVDTTPPTPNPATFASAPAASSDTVINMTATTASDASGPVEYQFVETSGNPGATSSAWQTSTAYSDSGLTAVTQYCYTVQSRDNVGNTGIASTAACATTQATPDTTPPTPNPATFASAPSADSDTAISMTATTASDPSGPVEYQFVETSGNPGATSSAWQTSTSYTDSGLTGSTQYCYTVQSRDSVGNTGSASTASCATTQATPDTTPPTPNPATFASAPASAGTSSISMTATTGSDPSGPIEYFFTETSGNPGGSNSVWQTSTSYTDTLLSPSTQYCYTVTSRDSVGNVGSSSSQSCATTDALPDIDPPTPNPATFATAPAADSETAVSMTATTGSDASGPVEYQFVETTGGSGATNSGWQTATSYTDSGLTASTIYCYTVQMRDSVGNTGTASTAACATTNDPPPPGAIRLETGVVNGVGSSWTTVNLTSSYTSMVVVATPNYDNTSAPASVRIQNATSSSFDVRVDAAGPTAVSNISVYYMVVEEGVYTQAQDGVTMEAVKYSSTVTDNASATWNGESRTYANSYTTPVVVGQVMTYNDAGHVEFWARGSTRQTPPQSGTLFTGKTVNEDPDNTHANETIGYIVIESGSGTMDGVNYSAGVTSDGVLEVTDGNAPFARPVSGLSGAASVGVACLTAMDGNNGGWGMLYGANPISNTNINLAIEEDQLGDTERNHTGEQVAFIVFEDGPAPPDTTPPTPNPMTFASAPSADSDTVISMTATTASDPSGPVEYLFTEMSGNPGGTSSSWQTSTSYTDSGLTASTQYTYTVTTRDSVGNAGSASAGASATTNAAPDTTPPTPNPATFASAPSADSDTAISMTATTASDPSGPVEYNFDNTSGSPGGTDSGWQTSTSYTDVGLSGSTQYCYTVQSRDSLGNTGSASSQSCATTQATPDTTPPTPNPATFASAPNADSDTAISMTATTASDPSGPVEYQFVETSGNPGATSSGWQTSTSYTDSGLTASTQYCYTVQARDSLGNTGAASAASCAITQAGGGSWTVVDNTDASIVYGGAGSWSNLTLYPSAINGTVQWNLETAGTVTYTFNGTGVRVHHWSYDDDHSVSISIDSVNQGTFNTGVSQNSVQIFETTSLSSGSHTIVITGVSGEPHFDAFEVFN